MRCAVWFSYYGLPDVPLSLPYQSRSPALLKVINYETEKDILEDVERLLDEGVSNKFGIGQSLYYQLPLFCNPVILISDWCWDMITDYFTVTKFNIPLARDLDSLNPWQSDCFSIIENELNNITIHERDKHGN